MEKGIWISVHFPLVCTDLNKFSVVQFNTVLKTAQKQNKTKGYQLSDLIYHSPWENLLGDSTPHQNTILSYGLKDNYIIFCKIHLSLYKRQTVGGLDVVGITAFSAWFLAFDRVILSEKAGAAWKHSQGNKELTTPSSLCHHC